MRFLALSFTRVIAGLLIAIYYALEAYAHPGFDIGIHFVLLFMILLSASQSLRQYRYVTIFEKAVSSKSTAGDKSWQGKFTRTIISGTVFATL